MGANVQRTLGVRYIDKSKFMSGSAYTPDIMPVKLATAEEMDKFISILSISQAYDILIRMCETDTLFFKSCPDLAKLIGDEVKSDLFYSYLIGRQYVGVPSKLIYILEKAKEKYHYPNLALSSIPDELMVEFTWIGSIQGSNIYDVICNVWKQSIKLLSPYRRRAVFGDCAEVYIENDTDGTLVDRIALLPLDINSCIQDNEVSKIKYDKKAGLTLNGVLLRTMAGHVGITKSDFDLRGVI